MVIPVFRKLKSPVDAAVQYGKENVRKLSAEYRAGELEAYDIGRSGWDMLNAFSKWLRSALRWLLVGIAIVLTYWFVGWYAVSALIASLPVYYVIATVYMHGRYRHVVVFTDDLKLDYWEIGEERFKLLDVSGSVSPVSSSSGNVIYLAEELNIDENRMVLAWVGEISSFDFLFDFRTHKRFLKLFGSMADEMIDKMGYPSVFGKLRAKKVMEAWIGDYDLALDSLKSAYGKLPDLPHELVETPLKDAEREAPKRAEARKLGLSSKPGGE